MKHDGNGLAAATDPRVAFFDQQAPRWDQTGPDPVVTLRRLGELEGRLGLVAGMDLLEVGCGTGQITGWLVERARPGRVVAWDFSPAMLAEARARGVDADFELRDICEVGEEARRFDVVLCFQAFPHFRDRVAAMRQMARQLKPSGELVVMHLLGSRQVSAIHHRVGGSVGGDQLPPATAWPELAGRAGLRVTEAVDCEDLFLIKARRVDESPRRGERASY
jgi:SAM-dependent methyltransferase